MVVIDAEVFLDDVTNIVMHVFKLARPSNEK